MKTEIYMLPATWRAALTEGNLTGLESRDLHRLFEFTQWMRQNLPHVAEINVVRDARENTTPVYKSAFHDARRFQPHYVDCHEYQFVYSGAL